MARTDAQLVQAVRRGDPHAFADLVRRHALRVAAVCRTRLHDPSLVEDMVQETFLRSLRFLSTLERPERFGSWLHGIALRACSDWRKARARTEVSLGASMEPASQVPPEDPAERHLVVKQAIGRLPEGLREAVTLFYYGRLSYQEISDALGITPAAVAARLTRARWLLRERLTTRMQE